MFPAATRQASVPDWVFFKTSHNHMIAIIKTNSKVSLNPVPPSAHCPRRLCGYFPNYLSGRWSLSRWRTTFHPHNRQQASLAFLRDMSAVVHNWNPSSSEGSLLKLTPLRCFSSPCWLNSIFFLAVGKLLDTKSLLIKCNIFHLPSKITSYSAVTACLHKDLIYILDPLQLQ